MDSKALRPESTVFADIQLSPEPASEHQGRQSTLGVPTVVPQVKNLNCVPEDGGSIPGLAQWVKDPVLP